jgi:hypothetical protein
MHMDVLEVVVPLTLLGRYNPCAHSGCRYRTLEPQEIHNKLSLDRSQEAIQAEAAIFQTCRHRVRRRRVADRKMDRQEEGR